MSTLKLTIDKKEYNFTLGLGFLGEVLDELDLDITQLISKYDKNPFKYVPILVYHSAKYSNELDNKEVNFTLKDIIRGIENDGALTDKNTSIIKFNEAFVRSLTKDVPVEEIEVNDAKEVVAEKK